MSDFANTNTLGKPMNSIVYKVIWKIGQLIGLFLRGARFRIIGLLLGMRIGRNVKCYGAIRFGSPCHNITIGDNCLLGADLFLSCSNSASLTIGNNCSINTGGHLIACESIVIGDGSRIGEYVSIRDQNHNFADTSKAIADQGYTTAPIIIGEKVWIGRGCHIAPGVTIGNGAVIGANSVVTKNIGPGVVAVGSPAREIRHARDHIMPA